ncbi:retrotransposon protein, putative, ty1-copia subclass [Tanacetum coccineum]
MHGMGKTVNEFHAMLKLHEQTQPKQNAPTLHVIRAGKVQKKKNKQKPQFCTWGKNQRKGTDKCAYHPKPKISPPLKKKNPAKDSICHQYGDTGYWKMNCPQNLAESLKNMKLSQGASSSGIFTIELYNFPNKSWVYDTGCGTHICNITQGLRRSRKLKPGALSLTLSRNNMVYFSAARRDGIIEIDLSNPNPIDSSMYSIINKRAKLNLDSALLWHCRLGHISKKRIKKLQYDGLLNSTDLKAFEKCVPCMSGKMARKPYTHQVERAKDLLGLIHTDVCGPFKITSREGANYFVTFTDDFSHYGYGYLDHEDYLRTIRTPLTNAIAQHNEVSERRNRTLLDMVQSMMSQTTLPKSFWDYALETAARILNMVPTKKVEKTPYEPDKLEPKSIKCIFIGYPKETMGYSFYYPPKNKVLVNRNAEFLESSLITQEASGSLEDLEIIQEEDTHPSIDTSLTHEEDDLEIDEPQSDIIPIRRSTRIRRPTYRMCLYIDAEEHELGDLSEHANYKASLLDPEFDKWLNAMNVEIKWLFKKKTDMDGAVHTYKARLVAKGYTQTPGIDYEETFSLVADIRAIRILIAIAAFMTMRFGKWMSKLPSSMDISLKRFTWSNLKKFGFTQNHDEPCVYLKASGSNVTFLILYVNDILIMGNNIPMLQGVKSYLGRCFAMKDLAISHREFQTWKYPMQDKLRLSKSQSASTPAELKRMQNVPYASAVGSIMYAVRCTRPDVAFAQNITSRFQ